MVTNKDAKQLKTSGGFCYFVYSVYVNEDQTDLFMMTQHVLDYIEETKYSQICVHSKYINLKDSLKDNLNKFENERK